MFSTDKTKKCGYTAKACTQHDCMFFQQFRGQNPQTGQEEDKWECVQVMLPILLLENSKQTRSISVAIDSSRDTMAEIASQNIENRKMIQIGE
jgi:hypothetical protein